MNEKREKRMLALIKMVTHRLNTGKMFPIPKAIITLHRQMIKYGFIDKDSDLRLFSALWGIGGIDNIDEYLQGHIKWLKDKQLLLFFLTEIGYNKPEQRDIIALIVFCSRQHKDCVRLPKKDTARLEATGMDYIYLKKILKEFC